MSLLSLIILIVVIGVILWAINTYIPMQPTMKRILNIAVIAIVVIWLLSVMGLLPNLDAIRVGK